MAAKYLVPNRIRFPEFQARIETLSLAVSRPKSSDTNNWHVERVKYLFREHYSILLNIKNFTYYCWTLCVSACACVCVCVHIYDRKEKIRTWCSMDIGSYLDITEIVVCLLLWITYPEFAEDYRVLVFFSVSLSWHIGCVLFSCLTHVI